MSVICFGSIAYLQCLTTDLMHNLLLSCIPSSFRLILTISAMKLLAPQCLNEHLGCLGEMSLLITVTR